MFESAVTKLVRSIGYDAYLPSPSVASSEHLSPLSLIERKGSRCCFGRNKYYTTAFSLRDCLLPSDTPLNVEMMPAKDICGFSKNAVINIKGKLASHFQSLFEAELDNVDSVSVQVDFGELQLSEVRQQSLLSNLEGRFLDMDHQLIKEISQKKRRALCIVVASVSITKETKIYATLNFQVDADAHVNSPVAGAEVSGDFQENKCRTLTLPAGTILAYEVLELAVQPQGQMKVLLSHGASGGFFTGGHDFVDAVVDMTTHQVSTMYTGLHSLSKEERQQLTSSLQGLSEDRNLLKLMAASKLPQAPPGVNQDYRKSVEVIKKAEQISDEVKTSIINLCSALVDLDDLMLSKISRLSLDQIDLLVGVLKASMHRETLPRESPLFVQLMSRNDICEDILIKELGYELDEKGLHPHNYNTSIIRLLYIVLYGLSVSY